MDEFFEKLKEHASKAKTEATKIGRQVYEKTNATIAVTKISFAINETDSKIKEMYESIGRIVYEKYLSQGEICDCVKDSCETIDELFKEKEVLLEKKAELKETVKCSDCGNYNKSGSSYCSKCGAKLTEDAEGYFEDEPDVEITQTEEEVTPVEAEEKEEAAEQEEDVKEEADEEANTADVQESVIKKVKKVITIKAKKPTED